MLPKISEKLANTSIPVVFNQKFNRWRFILLQPWTFTRAGDKVCRNDNYKELFSKQNISILQH